MSRSLSTYAEKFLWNNFKMYLMQWPTCLLDTLLVVDDPESENPLTRYRDFMNNLEAHVGLGSYDVQQASQFTNLPYLTVRISPYDIGHCSAKCIISFDVVFATDTPHNTDADKNPGNSSESVATFRANVMAGLDALMYNAYDKVEGVYESPAFFDRLRDQEIANPGNPEQTAVWKYNVIGTVEDDKDITDVIQLKREDRQSGLSVFTVTYNVSVDRLYGGDVDCGC